LETTTDTGGGYDLGATTSGQWFKYTVNVATAGTYTVSFRVAAPSTVTDAFHLSNSAGTNLSGAINVPATGGWQTWETVTATVTLPAGRQVLTLNEDTGGWNINWMSFVAAGASSGTWITAWTVGAVIDALGSSGDNGLIFKQQTEREILHTTVGGSAARIHLSNQYGTVPLIIGDVHIAKAQSNTGTTTVAGTDVTVTFGGSPSITIPAGGTAVSDVIKFPVSALSNVAVSIYFGANATISNATVHPFTEQTNYYAAGDVSGSGTLSGASTAGNYDFLTGLDVENTSTVGSVIALGASITGGYNSTSNANERWPDFLAQRLNTAGIVLGVGNMGIAGDQLTQDSGFYGDSALHRFTRDVVDQAGVKYVIFSDDPINDLGGNPGLPLSTLEQDYETMISQAHSSGIKFICSTLTPYGGSGAWTAQGETTREALNAWILGKPSPCDGVVDQAAATSNPADPIMYLPAYDSGDHLHPNDAGYQAIANAVNLSLF
jgi:lysophospholipase L1-like esterase